MRKRLLSVNQAHEGFFGFDSFQGLPAPKGRDRNFSMNMNQTSDSHTTKSKLKRVFVIGYPRSGTTWTMQLLAQHPAVVACQQSHFFLALKHFEDWWQRDDKYGQRIITRSSDIKEDEAVEAGDNSGIPLRTIISSEDFYNHWRVFATNMFDKMASYAYGSQVVVEQTPEHLELSELILKIFPDAYFLHVIRDPRSVHCSRRHAISSWATQANWSKSPIDTAKGWCSYIVKGKQIGHVTNRYKEIRYEALLEDGSTHLEQIFSWLNLPSDPPFCKKALANCTIEKSRKSLVMPPGFFRKGAVEGWREEMSSSELRTFEYIARDLMEPLGYKPTLKLLRHKPFRLKFREGTAKILKFVLRGPVRPPLRRLARLMRTVMKDED